MVRRGALMTMWWGAGMTVWGCGRGNDKNDVLAIAHVDTLGMTSASSKLAQLANSQTLPIDSTGLTA